MPFIRNQGDENTPPLSQVRRNDGDLSLAPKKGGAGGLMFSRQNFGVDSKPGGFPGGNRAQVSPGQRMPQAGAGQPNRFGASEGLQKIQQLNSQLHRDPALMQKFQQYKNRFKTRF